MQAEQDLIRNFCPFCIRTIFYGIKCTKCGTEDLISKPESFQELTLQEETRIEDNSINEPIIIEKSKLELDENAVDKLLTEPFAFLCGLAGTGKSTLITEVNRLYPHLLEIVATTGIASVNLGTKTINSTLKYFDTKSLESSWREQKLHYHLRLIRSRKQKLLIDEASMLDAEQLNLIVNAIDDINGDNSGKKLGLWLCGDLMQLPPIHAKYIFHSDYWERFEKNTIKLTKIWRQDNLEFMRGINLIRANKGIEAVKVLQDCGVTFLDKVNDNFEGTTLIPKNDQVDAYNTKRLNQIPGLPIRSVAKKLGKQLTEWEKNIPFELRVKKSAYVMILSNDIPEFNYVNGDTGIIEDYDSKSDKFSIRLKRNNKVVEIGRIQRDNITDKEPYPNMFTSGFSPRQDFKTGDWIIGQISFHPLRLAYASTLHKSQGLSLDLVQIDSRHSFFGAPSMGYVSISRARTPHGLFIVGSPESVGKKITMAKEVQKYV